MARDLIWETVADVGVAFRRHGAGSWMSFGGARAHVTLRLLPSHMPGDLRCTSMPLLMVPVCGAAAQVAFVLIMAVFYEFEEQPPGWGKRLPQAVSMARLRMSRGLRSRDGFL